MSVALMIDFNGAPGASLYVPIAGQRTYAEIWVPAANHLGLTLLPLFETGCLVAPQDLDAVIDEVRRLRAAVEGSMPALLAAVPSLHDLATRAAMLERLSSLLDALTKIQGDRSAEVWIG